MSLLDNMSTEFCIMEKTRVEDGEGSTYVSWVEGVHLNIAVVHDTTMQAQAAEATANVSTYEMYIPKGFTLVANDFVKRLSDGATLVITSDTEDDKTPNGSGIEYSVVTARKGALPK